MYLPPLQPVINSDSYLHGDVTIHPQAAIASGVILQASPDCRIVIEEQVCIGMGVIIHAYQGVVRIKRGAILGAGVLIMGAATIGANCCIGASSTLINTNVESQAAIAPGTLLGDSSRQIEVSGEAFEVESQGETPGKVTENSQVTPQPETKVQETEIPSVELPEEFVVPEESTKGQQSSPKPDRDQSQQLDSEKSQQAATPELDFEFANDILEEIAKSPVVGKMYVNQLLVTLFPQNQNFKKQKLND